MDTFDLKKYLAEGRLFEDEVNQLGDELADEIKDILDDEKDSLKEVASFITILSVVLASTTLLNILSKFAGKIFKKFNFPSGEKGAKAIEKFTEKAESKFKSPIKKVVSFFTKDESEINMVTNSLFLILILVLAVLAGGGAVSYFLKGDATSASISSLKAALKGKDLNVLIKDIATNAPV